MQERRRTQNRNAQRAFRDRQNQQVETLERQLKESQRKYETLLQSYMQQRNDIIQLQLQICQLSLEFEWHKSRRTHLEELGFTEGGVLSQDGC
jgi:hypothetical protein